MRWFFAVVILLVLSFVLQAGLVAYAGYVLLGLLALTRFLARQWIESLDASFSLDTSPREIGDQAKIAVKVINTGKLFIPWVLVEHSLPGSVLKQKKLALEGRRLKVLFLRAGKDQTVKYTVTFLRRGYYQFGPLFVETGDVFGLHRRHRVLTKPQFILVYPKVLPIAGYDFSSRRPIGEVRLANRLFEDPTRTAGVRPYQLGDPLQRVHWRATARTGTLHSRVYEPTTLAGATLVLDFHESGFFSRGEPHRSELAITLVASLANAIARMNQPVGFASNGRDATDRIRDEAVNEAKAERIAAGEYATRGDAREMFEEKKAANKLKPVQVETRRGYNQFEQIRETLARLELAEGLSMAQLLYEIGPRLTRDATLIAVLPQVPVETSVALGQLRRQGFAITALLVAMNPENDSGIVAHGRLAAEGIRDVRHVNSEADLMALGSRGSIPVPADYALAADLA